MLLTVQFLATFGCAAFTGMLLTIGMSFGSYWKKLSPEQLMDWFATNPRGAARPLALILLPTLIGLCGSLWLEWKNPAAVTLWIGAIIDIGILMVFTVAYFFPVNGKLESKTMPLADVPSTLGRWLTLHWIRVALSFLASVLCFIAVTQ
jgi:Domain of unknown function (DUF1772)